VSPPGDARIDRVDILATVLLAIATVATAWSGYQASRWNGEQAKAGARANAARIESARSSGLANAQTQIDVATFTEWIDAYARKETRLADFYIDRFRAEFKPMPQYKLAARAKADLLQAQSEEWATRARSYIQRSTNYVLGVVLFAATLFFAGMCAKLSSRRLRVVLLGLGVALFVGTVAWIASSPVSVSV
jgi:hypothetical protein